VSEPVTVDDRVSAMEAQLARFAVDVTEAAAKIQKVEGERDEYRKLVLHLREEVERLRRGLLGQKAERLPRDDGQLSLAILTLAMAGAGGAPEAEAAIEEELVAEHTRRKPVRKPPPADLPRVKIVLTGATGSSWVAKTAPSPTPPSSPCLPAPACTASSPLVTSATSSAFSRAGQSTEPSISPRSTGQRPPPPRRSRVSCTPIGSVRPFSPAAPDRPTIFEIAQHAKSGPLHPTGEPERIPLIGAAAG
jgi:Transposase C of IS166 homeodomain